MVFCHPPSVKSLRRNYNLQFKSKFKEVIEVTDGFVEEDEVTDICLRPRTLFHLMVSTLSTITVGHKYLGCR